jgi:hypothetical protein
MRALSILCATASALAGCEPLPDSTEIATRDMSITLDAADDGDGAKVRIWISSPLGAVRLTGTDSIRFTAADTVWPLKAKADSDDLVYVAELGRVSGDLVIDLARRRDHSAHAVATMPPPFTLTAQGPSTTQPLAITWEAGSGDYIVSLAIAGDCIRPLERTLAKDTGAYRVQLAELQHTSPSAPATCPLQVTLTRASLSQGQLVPPPQEGGWFNASTTQRRTMALDWQP